MNTHTNICTQEVEELHLDNLRKNINAHSGKMTLLLEALRNSLSDLRFRRKQFLLSHI